MSLHCFRTAGLPVLVPEFWFTRYCMRKKHDMYGMNMLEISEWSCLYDSPRIWYNFTCNFFCFCFFFFVFASNLRSGDHIDDTFVAVWTSEMLESLLRVKIPLSVLSNIFFGNLSRQGVRRNELSSVRDVSTSCRWCAKVRGNPKKTQLSEKKLVSCFSSSSFYNNRTIALNLSRSRFLWCKDSCPLVDESSVCL